MGPRRDFIAELGVAVRRRGMKFGVSSRQGKNPATTLMSSELDAGCWMESRQPRFLRDQSRQAAGRRGWIVAFNEVGSYYIQY